MGARYVGSYAGKARPIATERDYAAVKQLVAERCKGIYILLEAERLEALIRELTDYDSVSAEAGKGGVSVVRFPDDGRPPFRRWSDLGGLNPGTI